MIQRIAPLLVLLAALPAHAVARVSVNENTFVDIRLLLQTWAQTEQDGAPSGDSYSKDIFVRRGRIILGGQLNEKIAFFFDTDAINYGRNDFAADIFIQDAYMTFKLDPLLFIDAGFMYPPLTHMIDQAASTLFTLDFYPTLFHFPEPGVENRVNRDAGVQLRGILANTFQYRLGVFKGVRGTPAGGDAPTAGLNPNDDLRFNGQLRYNFLEPELDAYFALRHAAHREPGARAAERHHQLEQR